LLKA